MGSLPPTSEWRLTTAGGIPYRKLNTEGSFGRDKTGSVTETYLIEASSLVAFCEEMFPKAVAIGDTFSKPWGSKLPGNQTLYPQDMKFEGFIGGVPSDPFSADSGAPTGTYDDYLKVTITYGPKDSEGGGGDPEDPETWLEVSANGAAAFLQAPLRGGCEWDGGDEAKEQDVYIPIRDMLVDWTLRWPGIPREYFKSNVLIRLRDRLGMVNDTAIHLLGSPPPETLLFISWSMRTDVTQMVWNDPDEDPTKVEESPIELEVHFTEKNYKDADGNQVTHNHVYRPGHGWRRLWISGEPLYEMTNLWGIFTG